MAIAHGKIGEILVAQAKLKEALASFEASLASHRAGLAIAERLAAMSPDDLTWKRDVAVSHWTIARVLADQKRVPEAVQAFEKAHAVIADLKRRRPDHAPTASDLDWIEAQIKLLGAVEGAEPRLPPATRQ